MKIVVDIPDALVKEFRSKHGNHIRTAIGDLVHREIDRHLVLPNDLDYVSMGEVVIGKSKYVIKARVEPKPIKND